jgi:hypothetical protein
VDENNRMKSSCHAYGGCHAKETCREEPAHAFKLTAARGSDELETIAQDMRVARPPAP